MDPQQLDDFVAWKVDGPPTVAWAGGLKIGASEFSAMNTDLAAVTFEPRRLEATVVMHLRGANEDGALDAAFATEGTADLLALLEVAADLPSEQGLVALFSTDEAWSELMAAVASGNPGRIHQAAVGTADYYGPFSVAFESRTVEVGG